MANTLVPSVVAVATIKTSIANALATDLPSEVRASMIAPLLAQVNQWASQIPVLVETLDHTPANLVFSIRKELFLTPPFTQCVLGIPIPELPSAFQEFLNFIHKLIDAQKSDKDKPIQKVFLFPF